MAHLPLQALTQRPAPRQPLSSLRLAAAGLLPVVAVWIVKEYVDPQPFWVYYHHFETLYHHLGVRLLDGLLPTNVDNPGVPLILLSAAIAHIVGPGPGPDELELFRSIAHAVALILTVLSAWLLVHTLFSRASAASALIAVWLMFLPANAFTSLHVWRPEALYPSFSMAAVVIVAHYLSREHPSKLGWLYAGAAVGACIAVKLTFLSWLAGLLAAAVLVPLDRRRLLGRLRDAALLLAGCLLGFALFGWTALPELVYISEWISQLISHRGDYGTGIQGAPTPSQLWQNLRSALGWNEAWSLALGSLATATAWILGTGRESEAGRRLLTFGAVALVLAYATLARHDTPRYLLTTPALAVVLWWRIHPHAERRRIALGVCTVLTLLAVTATGVSDLLYERQRTAAALQLRVETQATLEALNLGREATVIYGWRYPEESFALRHHRREAVYQQDLDRLYPHQGYYVPWDEPGYWIPGRQRRWEAAVVRLDTLEGWPLGPFTVEAQVRNYAILVPAPRPGGDGAATQAPALEP